MSRRWQAMTAAERAEFVAESNRAECEAQGIPRYVTDPAHLEPVVRAVLAVAIPPAHAAAVAAGVDARAGGIGASSRVHATTDLRGSGSQVGQSDNGERCGLTAEAASARRSNKNTTRAGSPAKNARPSSPIRKGA